MRLLYGFEFFSSVFRRAKSGNSDFVSAHHFLNVEEVGVSCCDDRGSGRIIIHDVMLLVSGRLLIDHLAEDVARDCETLLCLHDEFFLLGDLVDGSAWLQEEVVLVKQNHVFA